VMARRMFAPLMRLPPLIHHEDGINADEVDGPKRKRVLFRRLGLPAARLVVVPSAVLEEMARDVWRQPARRVRRIGNGIAVERYGNPPVGDVLPGFVRREGDVVIGTIAGLRTIKNLARLVTAIAALPPHVRLVIAGEEPERPALEAQIARLGLGDRVHLAGFLDRPWRFVGAFDVVALSSLSEQFPIAVLEGMAAGLPIVATDVGDVAAMVATENRAFVVPEPDGAAFVAEYDEATMIAEYANIYQAALGRAFSLTTQSPQEPL
jgi:glycosyltransferase involved in cell wall biosynthesis